jgi:hypothetical protein
LVHHCPEIARTKKMVKAGVQLFPGRRHSTAAGPDVSRTFTALTHGSLNDTSKVIKKAQLFTGPK